MTPSHASLLQQHFDEENTTGAFDIVLLVIFQCTSSNHFEVRSTMTKCYLNFKNEYPGTSEQHKATHFVNLSYLSDQFRLKTETSSESNKQDR